MKTTTEKHAVPPKDDNGYFLPKYPRQSQSIVIHRSGFTYLETFLGTLLFALLGMIFGVYLASNVTLCMIR